MLTVNSILKLVFSTLLEIWCGAAILVLTIRLATALHLSVEAREIQVSHLSSLVVITSYMLCPKFLFYTLHSTIIAVLVLSSCELNVVLPSII